MELENKLNFNDLISEIINQKVIIETKTGTEKEVAIQKLKELESKPLYVSSRFWKPTRI